MKRPSADDRSQWLARLGDAAAHDEIASGLPCLHEADVEPAADAVEATGWLRVAAWNIERGRRPTDIAALLRSTGAHLALLTEVDVGMARTNNRDVGRDVASALGWGVAYGVEFVELSSGTPGEAGRPDDHGLHGNAIAGPMSLRDARLVRLDGGGAWFGADSPEPRIGGRMALVATITLDGVDVTLVSVHLESNSDPSLRAHQMTVVFDAVPSGPAIIGGDLNTFSASIADLAPHGRMRQMRADEPTRFAWPVRHEPLFAIASDRGYTWVDANLAAPTMRHTPEGLPEYHPLKLDWLFVRGLEARRPTVVPAIGPDGVALSDHDLIAASVRLPRPSAVVGPV